jgi:organic hydroperoxide reductase OsmC/OhrA
MKGASHETLWICRLERRPARRQGLGLDRKLRAGNVSLHVLQPLRREAGHTSVHLTVTAKIPGIDQAAFQSIAAKAKAGCPVSKLMKVEIGFEAGLLS